MKLAKPFNTVFRNREEAEWAFDLFRETIVRLGLRNVADKRFALTLRHNNTVLRLNFGNWMVLDVRRGFVEIALIDQVVKLDIKPETWGAFAVRDELETKVSVHVLPTEVVRTWSANLREVYEKSLDFIALRFKNWKASPYRHAHQAEIFEAFFDKVKQQHLLNYGSTQADKISLDEQVLNDLIEAGWNEEEIIQNARIGNSFVDFALIFNLYPLAILETKHPNGTDIGHAIQQAKLHAEGIAPFAIATDGSDIFQISTLDGKLDKLERLPSPKELWVAQGIPWNEEDPRIYPSYKSFSPKFFQAQAISRALEAIINGQERVLLQLAQGSGRSHIIMQLLWKLLNSKFFTKALIVSDRHSIHSELFAQYQPFIKDLQEVHDANTSKNPANLEYISINTLLNKINRNESLDFDHDLVIIEDYLPSHPWAQILEQIEPACTIAFTATSPNTSVVASGFDDYIYKYSFEEALKLETLKPPQGFYSVALLEIASIETGLVTTYREQMQNPLERENEWLSLIINAKDIDPFNEGGISLSNYLVFESQEQLADARKRYRLEYNDILVARNYSSGSRIRVAMVSTDIPGIALYSNSLFRIRVHPDVADPADVFTYLKSQRGQLILQQFSLGITVSRLSLSSLQQLPIFLPETEDASQEAPEELTTIGQAIQIVKTDVLPNLEKAENNKENQSSDLEIATQKLKFVVSLLARPSLEERVTIEYPTPIAIAYQRFLNARFNIYEQVMRLKDVYEAACFYIYNILLADVLRNEQKFYIRDKGSRRAFQSDSMASRMLFVKSVQGIVTERDQNTLFIPELVHSFDVSVTDQLRQELRNRVAHTATSTENQQKKVLEKFRPIVDSLLEKLDYLRNYPLVRIPLFYFEKGQLIRRMEVYTGVTPKLEEQPFSLDYETVPADRNNLVLINEDNNVLDLHPFYQLVSSERTHFETHLCFLKQRKALERSLLGESVQGAFEVELEGFDDFEELQARLPDEPISG